MRTNDGNGDFSRWGWTNGPLTAGAPGFWEWEIWAGAGQCDLTKGTLVGTLTVLYSQNGHVEVTYTMDPGFELEETHLYVGTEILQRDVNDDFTVAPGQYDNIHEELEVAEIDLYQFQNIFDPLTETAPDLFIVAHAVVTGVDPG